jgi:ring-1,2-phenylacetyl-CoA epoxidase subunit PaaD
MPIAAATDPDLHRAQQALALLTDPEIPVLTLADLGVLRQVHRAADGAIEAVLTPTYSGCPAMEQMADDARATFARLGLHGRVRLQLSPAWTTDWITPAARDALRRYGIAPPGPTRRHAATPDVLTLHRQATRASDEGPDVCPRCASADVVQTSAFGSTACKAAWRCLACREPFDWFKPY